MDVYLVGGAVRDQLLGIPVTERDYVVVGATPDELVQAGYLPVGRDFPVFLHPKTHDEYALARTERKQGHGYKGFTVYAGTEVTLVEDLLRRDLTINAMALSPEGILIDPYGGQADLAKRVLRHVSPAFSEDPLRVLRLARFAARFADLGFTIAPETRVLAQTLCTSGELAYLVPERIWQEIQRTFHGPHPDIFWQTLAQLGALRALVPASAWHERWLQNSVIYRLAAAPATLTLHRLWGILLLSVYGLDSILATQAKVLGQAWAVPAQATDYVLWMSAQLRFLCSDEPLEPQRLLAFIQGLDYRRRPERFNDCYEDCLWWQQVGGFTQESAAFWPWLADIVKHVTQVNPQAIIKSGVTGAAISEALTAEQAQVLSQLLAKGRAPQKPCWRQAS